MHFAMHFAHFFRLQKIKVPQVQMAVRWLLSCGRPDLRPPRPARPGRPGPAGHARGVTAVTVTEAWTGLGAAGLLADVGQGQGQV